MPETRRVVNVLRDPFLPYESVTGAACTTRGPTPGA